MHPISSYTPSHEAQQCNQRQFPNSSFDFVPFCKFIVSIRSIPNAHSLKNFYNQCVYSSLIDFESFERLVHFGGVPATAGVGAGDALLPGRGVALPLPAL